MNRMVSFPSTPLLLAQISVDVCACVCILRGPGILAFLRYVIKDTRAFGLQCTGHGVLCRNIFILGQSRKSISQGSMALNMKTKKKKKLYSIIIHNTSTCCPFSPQHSILTLWASKCCRSLMDAQSFVSLLGTFCNVTLIYSNYD